MLTVNIVVKIMF